MAKIFTLKVKNLLEFCVKLSFPFLQFLSHDGANKLVRTVVEAPRLKQNFDLEGCLDSHLVDHKVTLFPFVSGFLLVLVVWGLVGVYSYVMSLLTRRRAVDKPAVQTVLHNVSQLLQARRDSLKIVVTEKTENYCLVAQCYKIY